MRIGWPWCPRWPSRADVVWWVSIINVVAFLHCLERSDLWPGEVEVKVPTQALKRRRGASKWKIETWRKLHGCRLPQGQVLKHGV
jgi:hypothetical protein